MPMGTGYQFYWFFCRSKRNLHLFARFLFISAGIISMISGILIVAGQLLLWMLGSGWPELPLFVPFAFLIPIDGPMFHWLAGSGIWYGLNNLALWLLEHIPFSVFLFFIGLVMTRFPRPRFEQRL